MGNVLYGNIEARSGIVLSAMAPLTVPHFSTKIPQTTRFSEILLNTKIFFDFLYKFCLRYFSFQDEFSEILPYVSKGILVLFYYYIVLFLIDFYETWIFYTDFLKMFKWIVEKSVQWEPRCSLQTDGIAERHTWRSLIIVASAILRTRLKTVGLHLGSGNRIKFRRALPEMRWGGRVGWILFLYSLGPPLQKYGSSFQTSFPLTTFTIQKLVHLQLSQYKTSTPTTITIQNKYTYNNHNTKHVLV